MCFDRASCKGAEIRRGAFEGESACCLKDHRRQEEDGGREDMLQITRFFHMVDLQNEQPEGDTRKKSPLGRLGD